MKSTFHEEVKTAETRDKLLKEGKIRAPGVEPAADPDVEGTTGKQEPAVVPTPAKAESGQKDPSHAG
jgi:hypothetical protein